MVTNIHDIRPPADDGDDEPLRYATKLLTRDGLRALPKPEPLITNVLDKGTVALLYGRWGTLKSFIALDWAASIAAGQVWMGRKTERCKVLYIAAEGAFGLAARIDAWEVGRGSAIGEHDLHILPHPVNLTDPTDVADLIALIDCNGYGFVVIDTLARSMIGADENSARDCGMVVDVLTRLREHTPDGRGCVTGVHHAGKDGKTFRGSSVFEAGADIVYSTSADNGVITLEREKRKDGPVDDRHTLYLHLIDGTGSGVVSVHMGTRKTDRAERLLFTFVQHFEKTGASKAELRNVAGMDSATFYRALNDLLETGALINTGTEKRPFYKPSGEVSA